MGRMDDGLSARAEKLRETFQLAADAKLLTPDTAAPELPPEMVARLARFNIEWHIIPADAVVPFDDQYTARFYHMAPREFAQPREHAPSYRDVLAKGHSKHQGRVVGVETTPKPRYLPGNRQFYGTPYGFDASADPFAYYMGRAGLTNATRYAHNYISLREFVRVVNEDWRARQLLPQGYRLTVCPPAIFNLIGTLFHPEWSETETLELGFYRDEQGNATCYAVGCNAPGDFSYINEVELETDWTLAGFRLALVPE
jgi:hypothetical protein